MEQRPFGDDEYDDEWRERQAGGRVRGERGSLFQCLGIETWDGLWLLFSDRMALLAILVPCLCRDALGCIRLFRCTEDKMNTRHCTVLFCTLKNQTLL